MVMGVWGLFALIKSTSFKVLFLLSLIIFVPLLAVSKIPPQFFPKLERADAPPPAPYQDGS